MSAGGGPPPDQVDIEHHDPERVVYSLGAHATPSGSNEPVGFRNPWAALRLPTVIIVQPFRLGVVLIAWAVILTLWNHRLLLPDVGPNQAPATMATGNTV